MSRKYIEVKKVKWKPIILLVLFVFMAIAFPLGYNYWVEWEQENSIRCMYYTAMECPANELINLNSFYAGGMCWIAIGIVLSYLLFVEPLTEIKKYYIKGGK